MSVKAHELQNRAEMGESLKGQSAAEAEIRRVKGRAEPDPEKNGAAERLAQLVAAIDAAGEIIRPPRSVADGACFGMGRDATLAHLKALTDAWQ